MVNSFASSVTARNTVVVHRRLSRDHDVELVETNRRGHATRFAHDAARRGVDVVVGFGGDGTLNEVATGIAGTDTALGVLPGGSTNVFARTIGLPNDPVAAVELLAGGIDAGDFRPIGLGRVNGRFFCFHTGVGFDAAVVRDGRAAGVAEALARPPAVHHRRAHDVGSRATTAATRTSGCRPPTRVVDDGYFSIVLNTNPYTYLGNRAARPVATRRPSTAALVALTFRTMQATHDPRARSPAPCAAAACKPSEHLDEQVDLDHARVRARAPVPLPARRRLPRRDRPASSSPRPRRRPPRLARRRPDSAVERGSTRPSRDSVARARPAQGGEHHVGDVGADAVDAARRRARRTGRGRCRSTC